MTLPESLSLVFYRYKKKFCLKFRVKMKEIDLHLESVLDFLIFIPKKSSNKVFTSNHNLFSEFKNFVLQMYLLFCAQKLFVAQTFSCYCPKNSDFAKTFPESNTTQMHLKLNNLITVFKLKS